MADVTKRRQKPQTPTSMGMISGEHVDIFNMDASEIKVWDIVWSLHFQNRYNGHTPVAWDVLSHSALTYTLALRDALNEKKSLDPKDGLCLLIHDAAEAYTGDLIRPLKAYFEDFVRIENKVLSAILDRFNIREGQYRQDFIKHYDNEALWTEQAQLGRTNDLVYGNPNFNKATMLKLAKCSPEDFVDQLRTLCIQTNVKAINDLFAVPDTLKPYIGRQQEPITIKHNVLDDAVDVTGQVA